MPGAAAMTLHIRGSAPSRAARGRASASRVALLGNRKPATELAASFEAVGPFRLGACLQPFLLLLLLLLPNLVVVVGGDPPDMEPESVSATGAGADLGSATTWPPD